MKTLLIIGYVWPEPNSSAAGTRMMQLIQLFLNAQYPIHFASPATLGNHRQDLTHLGVQEHLIEINSSQFDVLLTDLQPDLVIFDRFMMEEQFGWRVAKYCPKALRVLNTEDLHSLRDMRHQIIKQQDKAKHNNASLCPEALFDSNTLKYKMATSDLALREIAAIQRSDLNLMISAFESELLQQSFQVSASHVYTLPFMYPLPQNTLLEYAERQHFVFIGNFRHAPNWDAVLQLKQLWPQIKKHCPGAECHIYGAYPPKKATALHNEKQKFFVKGWAEDAQKVIKNARVLIAPIRFGAGIKGKIAEAMMLGTPIVTTDIGAEAMQLKGHNKWAGRIANQQDEFITAASELYNNPETWQAAQSSGREIFEALYQFDSKTAEKLIDKLNQLSAELDFHRQQNFTGKMLNHHHHKSTQYMAQWIEAKNKLPKTE